MPNSIKDTNVPDIIIDQLYNTFENIEDAYSLIQNNPKSIKTWLIKIKPEIETNIIEEMQCHNYNNFIKLYINEITQLITDYIQDEFQ